MIVRSIASKLTRIYLVVAVVVLLSAGLASQWYLYHFARSVAHENLNTQAVALAGNLESAVTFGDAAFARQTLSALQHYPDVRLAAVVLPDGKLFAHFGLPDPESAQTTVGNYLTQGDFMAVQRHGVVQTVAQNKAGSVRLVMVASLEKLNHDLQVMSGVSLAVGSLILFAAFRLFRRMSHAVTQPLEQLTGVMRAVEREGDYSQRAAVVSNDEVGELAQGFNAMLSALEQQNTSLTTELGERKRMQEKLDHLAHYDPVTRLPNRRYFQDRLKTAVRHSLQLDLTMAVLFVDLDNFKLVNDSYGHHVGDILLQTVAERLTQSLRAGDVVCRLGGDEFAIILGNLAEPVQLAPLADKLVLQLAQPVHLEHQDLVVSGSIGAALCPEDADTPEALLRFADAAMYAAKGEGRNTWRRFNAEMANQSTLRLNLEGQMRQGMAEGQFEVHYQPQVNLDSGAVTGVEALARWNHPERGYISPEQFIPVAEESGLIHPLGEWVLRQACQQGKAWQMAGYCQLKVAVNVSMRQLSQADFTEHVLDILTQTRCPAHLLELEITESMLMQNSDKTLSVLRGLRRSGIGIAIDDFGTGYSSMAQLKNMPVTKLKIDKSFIDDITTDRDDLAITTAMTSLANNLRIQVITEGVESQAQVDLLRQSGCHNFQGYLFARAMPAANIAAFIDGFRQQHQTQPSSGSAAACTAVSHPAVT